MDDERRRYLAQQAELGGPEVILEPGNAGRAKPEPRAHPGRLPSPPPPAPAAGGARAAESAAATEGAEPKWKKGAPPIPGPGLVIELPAPTLLSGDPLAELDSLDAVAERIRTTHCCGLCPDRTHAVPGEGNPRA